MDFNLWEAFASINFFSAPNILWRQWKEDMKYEKRRQAISCDLVQVWAPGRRRRRAFTKYVRSSSGNPSPRYWYKSTHYPLRAGIDTDYLQRTLPHSADVLWGRASSGQDFTVALARRPPGCYFDTHPTLAIFSSPFLLFWHPPSSLHPPHFSYFFIHISATLLFWQPACSFCRPTFVKTWRSVERLQFVEFFKIRGRCEKTNPCTCVTSHGSGCSFE